MIASLLSPYDFRVDESWVSLEHFDLSFELAYFSACSIYFLIRSRVSLCFYIFEKIFCLFLFIKKAIRLRWKPINDYALRWLNSVGCHNCLSAWGLFTFFGYLDTVLYYVFLVGYFSLALDMVFTLNVSDSLMPTWFEEVVSSF